MVKRLVTGWVVFTWLVVPIISSGAVLNIDQEGYLYQMPLTQNVYAETFVISSVAKGGASQEAIPPESFVGIPAPSRFTNKIITHFQINSAELSAYDIRKIVSEIHRLNISPATRLIVTGYTCQKGSDLWNYQLSTDRANTVASLLRREGLTVEKVIGKAADGLISTTYFPINRRVEISTSER